MSEVSLAARLRERDVPSATVAALEGDAAVTGAIGVVLYGSYARGDHTSTSDVDVLVVAARPSGSRKVEIANVATYTPAQLASARGSLFGMHLAHDGLVIDDTDSVVAGLLASMGEPDPALLFERIRHLGAVLDGDPSDHLGGRIRVARYLLRTAVYVAALAEGEPCFSVRELAERAGESALARVLSANADMAPPVVPGVLDDLLARLRGVVGPLAPDPYGGLRSLIVTEWFEDAARASLGVLVLADERDDLDYTALAKVIL
jgi:predicted nucleotidyltransferase